ncbi:nucleoid-associated protein [Segetibacter sp. 3557_3]|uniref:nucleoid-associated protein n=1 Tax=Segetibacter sp. 3557_3 TaxID=2547429 RepID=UPI0010585542|nr:nucleoid-associated protein [Segetibacter sp. 3557_3]TDH25591.1 nucleoid-associated protein [Segetibacter sp. 3557_3]
MTGIDSVEIRQAIIHKVGNPTRGEELKLSANNLTLNDEIVRGLLAKYFLAPFNENDQHFFTHNSDVALNTVYNYVSAIFDDPKSFTGQSALLAQFLYSKSTHARVKEGELYVALFHNVPFGTEYIEAIGIFKSETRETFLKVFSHGQSWEVGAEDGININKLDKGCLVFKVNRGEGYVCCVVDSTNKQDAQYWVNDFLQLKPYANSYHQTDQLMGMCKLFISNEMQEKFEVNKSDQIDMLNRSMEYFKTKDQFNLDEFSDEVIYHPEVQDAFKQYKQTYQQAKEVEIHDDFDIHLSAVKKQERAYKSILKLDKNFHVYIHGRKDLIEKGYDEMKGKHFYKLYFDEES